MPSNLRPWCSAETGWSAHSRQGKTDTAVCSDCRDVDAVLVSVEESGASSEGCLGASLEMLRTQSRATVCTSTRTCSTSRKHHCFTAPLQLFHILSCCIIINGLNSFFTSILHAAPHYGEVIKANVLKKI